MTTTSPTTASDYIAEDVIDAAARAGLTPEDVKPNRFGGYDLPGAFKGDTIRVCLDDERVIVHTFTGGRAMSLTGTTSLDYKATALLPAILASLLDI